MTGPESIVSLVDVFTNSLKRYGPLELFGTKTGDQWRYITYADFGKLVEQMRGGLATLGVGRGDKVGIISNNRVEWAAIAYAVYGLGAVIVPMYESQLEKDWSFIVRDSELKVLFVANEAILEKTKGFPAQIPSLKHLALILAGPNGKAAGVVTYEELLQKGSAQPAPVVRPEGTDIAALLYTSGTTGNPKGVVLTHNNVVSNVLAVQTNLPMVDGDRSLSFLPWAHSFGHTCELHILVSIGASTGICDSNDKIVPYLAEVKPTVLFAVPRIFNRIYSGVEKQMQSKPAPIRSLFRAGLRIAAKKRQNQPISAFESITLALADKLVFSKVRARFGGKLKYAISGAAALAREVADFVDGLGITVYEGYGLTETSPIVSCNVPGHRKLGSVGRPIPGVRVVIDTHATGDPKNGEIVIYGPNVMQGYYKNKAETDAVFTPDGGFRTGDMGYLDDDNYLYITGRIKEQYKLENGKYVVPSPLEELVKLSPFVNNVMIYGDNKPFNVALIVANVDAIKEWGAHNGVSQKKPEDLLSDPKVRQKMREELDRVTADFKGYERIRNFALIAEDFTLENDMLTPKMSVKRRNVLTRWQKQIDQLYA
jgi:long-chain acyl-CoA synthetase